MKHIKFILFLLAIPYLLFRMKMEHSKMEREKKERMDQQGMLKTRICR